MGIFWLFLERNESIFSCQVVRQRNFEGGRVERDGICAKKRVLRRVRVLPGVRLGRGRHLLSARLRNLRSARSGKGGQGGKKTYILASVSNLVPEELDLVPDLWFSSCVSYQDFLVPG